MVLVDAHLMEVVLLKYIIFYFIFSICTNALNAFSSLSNACNIKEHTNLCMYVCILHRRNLLYACICNYHS